MEYRIRKNLFGSSSEGSRVVSDTHWRDAIDIIGATQVADTNESRIARAALRTGINPRKLRGLYYGETAEPKYSVGKTIDAVALKQADRFLAVADGLERQDADFFLEEINRLRGLAKRIRASSD